MSGFGNQCLRGCVNDGREGLYSSLALSDVLTDVSFWNLVQVYTVDFVSVGNGVLLTFYSLVSAETK